MPRAILVVVILFMILAPIIPQLQAVGQGYLAIKDYLGTVWTMDDVNKIINKTINTSEGPKSLADYFWIVIDNNAEEKYNLRDFTASPLDGKTAVLPLPAGDHYVDIYWFGYHQRQLVHIVEDQHYVLKLETAPVVPFKTAGEPPSSAEWDLTSSPDGLVIQRKDGKASVRFVYNQSYIEVKWYDGDLGGWQYQDLDIYIDTNYQYKFHVKDPANPSYYEEKTGSFLWLSWDVYKVKEIVKWNRTGEILHVSYIVGIAENDVLLKGEEDFWNSVAVTLTDLSNFWNYVSPVTFSITSIKDFVGLVQGAYDSWMGKIYASKYQKTVLIIWDVFTTPTQIVVLAHCYDVDQNGNISPKPITSANAFTINNRLVYIKQLQGGLAVESFFQAIQGGYDYTVSNSMYPIEKKISELQIIGLPTLREFDIDDLSMYDYELWYQGPVSLTFKLIMSFDDQNKANVFKQQLDINGISYNVDSSGKVFTFTVGSGTSIINDFNSIERLIPSNSSGSVMYLLDPVYGDKSINGWFKLYYHIIPKLEPPSINLLKDGYVKITRAYGVQVYTDLYREDKDAYMLGYYLLDNEPPPSYIIRDVYYDIDNDVMHYVYTVISADCYGQDITGESSNGIVIPSSIHYLAKSNGNYQPYIELYYDRLNYYLTISSSDGAYSLYIVLKNGTTLTIYENVKSTTSGTLYFSDYNITINDIDYIYALLTIAGGYGGVQAFSIGDGWAGATKWISVTVTQDNPIRLRYKLSIRQTVRTINNTTLALFNYNKMAFLNLAPEVIRYLLALPPSQGGYGTPIIDWSTISTVTINMSRPYELYYWDSAQWVKVTVQYDNTTLTYTMLRASDQVAVESLSPGDMSQYYYKLVYTDTNTTYKGWLYNKNGTLRIITGKVEWSLTPQELDQLMQQLQLQGIYDKWLQRWNTIAEKLGLIADTLNKINQAFTWLGNNWKWILLGLAAFFILIILVLAAGARSDPRIVVSR